MNYPITLSYNKYILKVYSKENHDHIPKWYSDLYLNIRKYYKIVCKVLAEYRLLLHLEKYKFNKLYIKYLDLVILED